MQLLFHRWYQLHAQALPSHEINPMPRQFRIRRYLGNTAAVLLLVCSPSIGIAESLPKREEPLVDVAVACPGVLLELRYATSRNLAGTAIYPPKARALLRRSVADRIRRVQELLSAKGFRLKIWDAYRPPSAQDRLWAAQPNPEFVGNPDRGGSLHSWGVAVDVTLADRSGIELRMPTDFDSLTPSAARRYRGKDPVIAANLAVLQTAMVSAGFVAMRDEWWHFVAEDFREFRPVTPPVLLVEE